MNFDRLAPHYRWMEWLLAGRKLQRCRTAFLYSLPAIRDALLLGEGNGRFLGEFLKVQSTARVTCVDASHSMLDRARRCARDQQRIDFVHSDVLAWNPPPRRFDLVVSNFFLDCFRPEQIDRIVRIVSQSMAEGARWMIADFSQPQLGWRKWRAGIILQSMYWFFVRATGIPAESLSPPDPFLLRNGFQLRARRSFEWGLLQSDLWTRGAIS